MQKLEYSTRSNRAVALFDETMAFFKLAFAREMVRPTLAVVFASVACVGLVALRIAWTGNIRYSFLVWNLFLAWLPLVFALYAVELYRKHQGWTGYVIAFAAAWLLFFPNAPYICTDIIHLSHSLRAHFWVDLVLILSCAFTGLILGFLSLYSMQSVVQRACGWAWSWVFVAAVAGLSGVGIYIGRFLRFNSWDIITQPLALTKGVGKWASAPMASGQSFAFPLLFAAFLFIAYLVLYALTHLRQPHSDSEPAVQKPTLPTDSRSVSEQVS
jgi:uncharacterized membrane protein